MPKNTVKPEAAEPYSETATSEPSGQNGLPGTTPYTEQTSLGGPILKIGSYGVMPCKLRLSSKILATAGMKPRDQVELVAVGDGQILIKKIGEPFHGLPITGCSAAKKQMLDVLMAETRAFEAEQRAARERRMAYREEPEAEPEEPLDEEQRRREEL